LEALEAAARPPGGPCYTRPMSLPGIDALIASARFDAEGLLPVLAQDASTGVVRMLAWANAEALRSTAQSGYATFWSRSRRSLWRKGETSGHVMLVHEMRIDCDGDTVLYLVDANGPSCHTGRTSCFYRRAYDDQGPLSEDDGPAEPPAVILSRLAHVIAARRQQPAETSYVASLLAKGLSSINAKITEEAREVTLALATDDKKHIAHEAADVIFHLLVGLEAARVPVDEVFAELRRRFGIGGLVEKGNRVRAGIRE
jgi:phosphoribosyl-AMP cyclohydrolase / phosphoribosyl-ATP pyrophosphohydrolase